MKNWLSRTPSCCHYICKLRVKTRFILDKLVLPNKTRSTYFSNVLVSGRASISHWVCFHTAKLLVCEMVQCSIKGHLRRQEQVRTDQHMVMVNEALTQPASDILKKLFWPRWSLTGIIHKTLLKSITCQKKPKKDIKKLRSITRIRRLIISPDKQIIE